jgi:hypothetical protein
MSSMMHKRIKQYFNAFLWLCRSSRVLLPLLFFTGLMNTLDRTNLSFAALQMNAQLRISAQVQIVTLRVKHLQ